MDTYIPKKISKEKKQLIDRDVLDLCIDSFHPFSIVDSGREVFQKTYALDTWVYAAVPENFVQ